MIFKFTNVLYLQVKGGERGDSEKVRKEKKRGKKLFCECICERKNRERKRERVKENYCGKERKS